MEYTTIERVSAELGGVVITDTSTPSTVDLKQWIREASDEVSALTGRVWGVSSVTSQTYEFHDYSGEGIIKLDNYPVISVESVEYEENGLGASAESWVSLSEGRTDADDFVVYPTEGILKIHRKVNGVTLKEGNRNIRVAYTYGYEATPERVVRLCTLLVVKRYIVSVANSQAGEGGGAVSVGVISVSDPNNYVFGHLDRITKEIDYLRKEVVSSFKVFDDGGVNIL